MSDGVLQKTSFEEEIAKMRIEAGLGNEASLEDITRVLIEKGYNIALEERAENFRRAAISRYKLPEGTSYEDALLLTIRKKAKEYGLSEKSTLPDLSRYLLAISKKTREKDIFHCHSQEEYKEIFSPFKEQELLKVLELLKDVDAQILGKKEERDY